MESILAKPHRLGTPRDGCKLRFQKAVPLRQPWPSIGARVSEIAAGYVATRLKTDRELSPARGTDHLSHGCSHGNGRLESGFSSWASESRTRFRSPITRNYQQLSGPAAGLRASAVSQGGPDQKALSWRWSRGAQPALPAQFLSLAAICSSVPALSYGPGASVRARLALQVVRFPNGLMHLACRVLATLTGSQQRMDLVTRVHHRFSACLPTAGWQATGQ